MRTRRTEIDELVGDVEAGLEAASLDAGGDDARLQVRPEERLAAAALRHKLDVHALAARVDGHVCPATAVGADRLAGVRRTVVDAYVVERTTA